ncbi:lysozyme inhibitor LprI family protein [Pseudovibrio exalbescens]|uniref:lysozyme inhibitor LprI family protein n=1 Tax=Pseudovibrio exalbescens TaxID=197461 RepID=UPI0023669624|nr:lysozyme inhibitor LprI family protein [Pseudovibrio exalbescens]MDD7910500.1 lysozyme inhibitor LprI family protein [Pseudovibrio exalbescens]
MIGCIFTGAAVASSNLNTPTPEDRNIMQACLAEAGTSFAASVGCIGRVFTVCQESPELQTSLGMRVCASRETELWDEKLNAAYQQVMESKPEPVQEQLRAAQRLWIKFRDADCEVPMKIYEGGSLGPVVAVQCGLQATALRALQMEDYARFP